MKIATQNHEALVGAIDHASRSLALARESLGPGETPLAPVAPAGDGSAGGRVRIQVGRIARMLEEARVPGRVAPADLDGAAQVLDRELGLLSSSGSHRVVSQLIETQIEERDGGTWISGLCPFCWERVAAKTIEGGAPSSVKCTNGHHLDIRAQRSARTR